MKKNNNADQPVLYKIVMLAAGLLIGFITVKSIFLIMDVKTDSMNPALKNGDSVIINKVSGIEKGDVVAFDSPIEEGKILLSRVIAVEYDTVEIRNKILFVNDKKTDIISDETRNEKIIYPMKFCFRDNMPPVKLERNEFFLLGDNFDSSFDSRSFGKIPADIIIGKIVYKK
ncbi:MAG: signal peptidase I [Spirochaetae bacterium HGW-Spirochaetae-5]|nr:MAG: signal peptidase I [Spirochaetae bacterium HGW-Spirochaetae-5]